MRTFYPLKSHFIFSLQPDEDTSLHILCSICLWAAAEPESNKEAIINLNLVHEGHNKSKGMKSRLLAARRNTALKQIK